MTASPELVVVQCTTDSREHAEQLANTIVHEQLAACVHIVGPIQSVYTWEDKLCHSEEFALQCKTLAQHFAALRDRIHALHHYECPEIIALPVHAVDGAYAEWVQENVGG